MLFEPKNKELDLLQGIHMKKELRVTVIPSGINWSFLSKEKTPSTNQQTEHIKEHLRS